MNIFALDYNPKLAAEYHNDNHSSKMILETAQILCTVHHSIGIAESWMYKPYQPNNPCMIWARQSVSNYDWLLELGLALGDEKEFRTGKRHKSSTIIDKLSLFQFDRKLLPHTPLQPFIQVMPEEYRSSNAIESYRKLYMTEKRYLANWTIRKQPDWFI